MTRGELLTQLRTLGVRTGETLVVHSSYRALRPIDGGPLGVIDALTEALGPSGTLVMPSWTDDGEEPFDPARTSALHLGIIADTFWRQPAVLRSGHAEAFAARGPAAARIVSDPLPLPPHIPASPIGRVHELDGWVLLLGVGHESNTMLHLAELLAGVPYGVPRSCTVLNDGIRVRLDYRENDHCCVRFEQLDGWLREEGLQRDGSVGHAAARLMRARNVVGVACAHLKAEPTVFLHPRASGCAECDEAWASVPPSL